MPSDPWASVRTAHGFAADEVISALQKEIRRGHAENAAVLAFEMLSTSAELEAMLAEAVFGSCGSGAKAKPLSITSEDGRKLPSGVVARWP